MKTIHNMKPRKQIIFFVRRQLQSSIKLRLGSVLNHTVENMLTVQWIPMAWWDYELLEYAYLI